MNADDRLSLDPLGPVEGGNRFVEGSYVADVCPQPTNSKPLDELSQLGAIGYDDEVDSQAARGPRLGRAGDGHQRSSGANHARGPRPDVAADDVEDQIDSADVSAETPCAPFHKPLPRKRPVMPLRAGAEGRLFCEVMAGGCRVVLSGWWALR